VTLLTDRKKGARGKCRGSQEEEYGGKRVGLGSRVD